MRGYLTAKKWWRLPPLVNTYTELFIRSLPLRVLEQPSKAETSYYRKMLFFYVALVVRTLLPVQMQDHQARWSLGWEEALEKRMAIHSGILAWRIPWTEEPDGLQSMGLQRVRHNWSNLACMHGKMCHHPLGCSECIEFENLKCYRWEECLDPRKKGEKQQWFHPPNLGVFCGLCTWNCLLHKVGVSGPPKRAWC